MEMDENVWWISLLGMVSFLSVTFILFCLKIKSTKKNPELLGTAGTVKVIGGENTDTPDGLIITNVSTGSLVSPSAQSSPPNRPLPGGGGERKLPDLPANSLYENGSLASELYDTVGYSTVKPPGENGPTTGDASDDSDPEGEASAGPARDRTTDNLPSTSHHPYAKVKKKEHPYATVKKPPAPPLPSQHPPPEVGVNFHPLGASAVPAAAEPVVPSQQQYFSGDSQDSSKGYTSISVREPLSHIHLNQTANRASRGQDTYVAVSETSDDMYAAIEDPSYIPTGTSQSNSDTYAVINLPEEEDEGGAVGGQVQDEKVHHYSKIDRTKKRRPPDPPGQPLRPHSQVPQPPIPSMQDNVEDMYAKVHKSPPPAVPRPRSSPFSKREINYSDFEVSHFDTTNVAAAVPPPPPPSKVKTATIVRRNVSPHQPLRPVSQPQLPFDSDAGYEKVKDVWPNEDGYEKVRNSKRFRGDSGRDPGYETVHEDRVKDPPYAKVNDSDLEEEGYETIPQSRSRTDPDYEIVPPLKKQDPGYETVPTKDPGYETVKQPADPGYEVVPMYAEPQDAVADPGQSRVHMSIRDMPSTSSASSHASSNGTRTERRSSVVVIEHVGASISMVATTSGQELPMEEHIFV